MGLCDLMGTVHYPLNRMAPAALQEPVKGDGLRAQIKAIAWAEIGVQEATGNNDGKRVEEYLRYTRIGKGYSWCAAFISWCYGQVGLSQPRNPWSPALFPNARTYCRETACLNAALKKRIRIADVFGIYGQSDRRINHVGLVAELQGNYLRTIEGNSNNDNKNEYAPKKKNVKKTL